MHGIGKTIVFLLCNGQIQDKYAFALQICLKNVAKYSYDFSMGVVYETEDTKHERTGRIEVPVADLDS